MSDVPALLQPMKDRLTAATPGPWAHYGDLGHEIYQPSAPDVNEPDLVAADVPRLADATFISNAPTDQAKLIAAVEAVDRVCADWAELADGDKYYAGKIRAALTQALGGDGA